jgi:hypothetical protein
LVLKPILTLIGDLKHFSNHRSQEDICIGRFGFPFSGPMIQSWDREFLRFRVTDWRLPAVADPTQGCWMAHSGIRSALIKDVPH